MASSTNPLAGRNFHDENGNPIVPGRYLNRGGEGVVYLVDGQPGSVMKIWCPSKTPPDADVKIRHMVENPVKPDPTVDLWRITWPQHLVKENGDIVGYTMPLLDPDAWIPLINCYNQRAARDAEDKHPWVIKINNVQIARNLILGFRAIHSAGYVIGDVNEKNVLVNQQNQIAMMDCDSYGFTGTYPDTKLTFSSSEVGRPDFQAPEAQGDYANRTQNHDLFGLAVLIFLLLTRFHPYTVTNEEDYNEWGARIKNGLFPPATTTLSAQDTYTKRWDSLTCQQRDLFLRCFSFTNYNRPRASPGDWLEALPEGLLLCPQCNLANSNALIYCENPSCITHLHQEYQYCTGCGAQIPSNARYCRECGHPV